MWSIEVRIGASYGSAQLPTDAAICSTSHAGYRRSSSWRLAHHLRLNRDPCDHEDDQQERAHAWRSGYRWTMKLAPNSDEIAINAQSKTSSRRRAPSMPLAMNTSHVACGNDA
jgi:hypothetical protein